MSEDQFYRTAVIMGRPMTTPACILAAMVIRLGGRVELTETELTAVEGLMISEGVVIGGGLVIEANTDPIHDVLSTSDIE